MEEEILKGLSSAEQKAVELVKVTIDCFNSRDGIGRFSGPARYNQLESMLPLVATRAGGSLSRFWGLLLQKMMWPVPPKRMDEVIIPLLQSEDGAHILRVITEQPASIVMLARYWHTEDKNALKVSDEEWQETIVMEEETTNE